MFSHFKKEIRPYLGIKAGVGILLLLTLMVLLGIARTGTAHYGSDFFTYYSSGLHFASGQDLYLNAESGQLFLYPPFAALFFQILNLVDMSSAVGLAFMANFALSIINLVLIFEIGRVLGNSTKTLVLAIFGALLMSFADVWANVNFSQINTLIFFLSLAGVYAFIKDKPIVAAVFWSLGAWLKVLPVIFILWAFIRKPSWRLIFTVATVSFVCLTMPIIQGGWELGLADLFSYYHEFLKVHTSGVNAIWRNQALTAALIRTFIPLEAHDFIKLGQHRFIVSETAQWIKFINLTVFAIGFGLIGLIAKRKKSVTITEIALVFLIIHLCSGITWKGHFLTMSLVFLPLFLGKTVPVHKVVRYTSVLAISFIFLIPIPWIGRDMFQALYENSLITWSLVYLYVCYVVSLYIRFQLVKHAST